jgi:hypothetical protein
MVTVPGSGGRGSSEWQMRASTDYGRVRILFISGSVAAHNPSVDFGQ